MNPQNDVYQGLGAISNRYARALIATWREAFARTKSTDVVPFSKEDVVRHGQKLQSMNLATGALDVKNVPDIIYTYRARADLPAEILDSGSYAIIGRGKGLYAFAKINRPNRFRIPPAIEKVAIENRIPQWVIPYMGEDEQGMLTKTAYNDLVKIHLGLKRAFRLQSHLRMGVPSYGQVEVDEIYAGERADGTHVIIAVEAKDASDNDLLNVSQLYGTSRALQSMFPGIVKHLLGVKPDSRGNICICEFAVSTDVMKLNEASAWKAYCLS